MAISDQFLDELSERLDIVDVVGQYVHLTKKGDGYWGLCPFHHEKTPSFHVSPDRRIFHCFGCNKGGGAVRFVMEMENLPFHEAVAKLAAQAGMEMPEDGGGGDTQWRQRKVRLLELNKQAARYYRANLSTPAGAEVAAYIRKRAISPKFTARFGLGAAPDAWDCLIKAMTAQGYEKRDLLDVGLAVAGKNGGVYDKFRNRLMLPVIDVRGDVIGFTSRVMDKSEPKYLNTPETAIFKKRSILYGLNYAKNTKRNNLILVEGNIDVITLHQAGFDNTVATMGTALTEEHIKIIANYTKELVLCYDNDNAGTEATQRALGLLKNAGFPVRVLRLPNAQGPNGEALKQDADDYIKACGPAAFESLLNRSAGSTEYRMDAVKGRFDLRTDEGKAGFLQEAADLAASLPSPVEREIYAGRAAEQAGVSREAMLMEVDRARKRLARGQRKKEERESLIPTRQLQPKARELRYKNPRSARAEEGVLRVVLLDSSYFSQLEDLTEEAFSSPLLGKVFTLLRRRWQEGKAVSLAALDGVLEPVEMDHMTTVVQDPQARDTAGIALQDYISIIRQEAAGRGETPDDLLSVREKLKQTKSYGGA